MIVFTLFILVCMLLAVGVAIDTVRTEFSRIHLQNVTDSAVLAAADLDQTLAPRAVVEDWVSRAGFDPADMKIEVTGGLDSRTVKASSQVNVPTMFIDMVGIETLAAPANGTAQESVSELEIALVLDNSGSMANNNNYRLNLLKPAAQNFIDQVLEHDAAGGKVAISIVPFATQVNAGPDLLKHLNASTEHGFSDCVTFGSGHFSDRSLTHATALERTGHFDPSETRMPPRDKYRVCRTDESRQITPWSDNADYLKGQIEKMVGFGWTSIEIGAKWGAALLDPAARPVLNAMIDDGKVDEKFRDQPFDYGVADENGVTRMKYLVIMSDGANTSQWDIKSPYREGLSPIFLDGSYADLDMASIDTSTLKKRLSFYQEDRDSSQKFHWFEDGSWNTGAEGGTDATQLTWPQVWNMMSVKYYTTNLYAVATGYNADSEKNKIVKGFSSGVKNSRTHEICKAARAEALGKNMGVVIYTIGMDTYGQGDDTLRDCATDGSYFYDVESEDLYQAFEAIARSINQLRLTN